MALLHHTLHALVYEAPDLPGRWISHCLELDLISQGDGQLHAIEMLAEAIQLVAEENLKNGRPPLDFRSAPADDWLRLRKAEPMKMTRILHISGELPDDVTIAPSLASAR